ncbi:ribosome maturation factor RimM [Clostridium sp.]|uniref:ribosome maturation factor RimM n=1 Tax=Clostridium sp. TaxID=1506 RepID=UPI002FC8F351
MKEFMSVGQISKPHGIRGEVKVISLMDSLEDFRELDEVFIDEKRIKITEVKLQKDRAILKIEGIDTVEAAERYRNKYLMIKREDAKDLPEDTYYVADLIGCTVLDTDGKNLGKIYDVIQTGSNDVYWVKGEGKAEVLIPVLKDIVVNIDINSSEILIKPVNVWSE